MWCQHTQEVTYELQYIPHEDDIKQQQWWNHHSADVCNDEHGHIQIRMYMMVEEQQFMRKNPDGMYVWVTIS